MRCRIRSSAAPCAAAVLVWLCAILSGCGGGSGGGGGQPGAIALLPSQEPVADLACAPLAGPAYAGTLRLELSGKKLSGATFEYQAGTAPWQPLDVLSIDVQSDRLHVITWDTTLAPPLVGRRVEDVTVRVTTRAGWTAQAGPFTADNSLVPGIIDAQVPAGLTLRGTIPVTAVIEGDPVEPFRVELAYSTGGAPYACATVRGPNPDSDTGLHTALFEWDALADVPDSLHGPVEVTLRVIAASGRFDPQSGIREITLLCDNRPAPPAPRIDLPADVLSVFERRVVDGTTVRSMETYASLAWSEAPRHLAAFPTFDGVAPRAAAFVDVQPESLVYLGTEDEVFEPPLVLARTASVGTVQGPLDYAVVFPAHGHREERTSFALITALAQVQVLGATEEAHVLHIADPTLPAQAALDLSASSFPELSGPYPYVAYDAGFAAPGAIIGMQVFVPGIGLAGVVRVDPATGAFLEEHVLTAQLPRPGLSGGELTDGRLSVWTIDARSGRPLAGVAVVVSQGDLVLRTRTGDDGRADFEGLTPDAEYAVVAGGRALAARGMAAARARMAVIPLEPAEAHDNELAITGGAIPAGAPAPIELPILLSTREDAVALQLSLEFDPQQVQIAGDGICAADTCALTVRAPEALGPGWDPNPDYFWLEFSNAQGWLVAGFLFYGEDLAGGQRHIIPAGTSRLHLLDLRVNGIAPVESTVRFVNGVQRQLSGGTSPIQHNVLVTAGGMSQIPVGIPGLLTAPGAFPAVELLGEEGGELQRTVSVSAELGGGESLCVTDAAPVDGPGTAAAEVARYGMATDAVALRREGGVIAAAAASFLGEPGDRFLQWRAAAPDALVPCDFSGAAPAAFTHGFTARADLLVLGPAGASGGARILLGQETPEVIANGVSFAALCPWLWALPSAAVITLDATDGAQSSVCIWDDAGAAAPVALDFVNPPPLLSPPATVFPRDRVDPGTPLRWTPVAGAAYHVVTVGDDTGAPVVELIVPGTGTGELVLPSLPETRTLHVRVPYTWFVTAVLCADGAAADAAALDMIGLAHTRQRAATTAARPIQWR